MPVEWEAAHSGTGWKADVGGFVLVVSWATDGYWGRFERTRLTKKFGDPDIAKRAVVAFARKKLRAALDALETV